MFLMFLLNAHEHCLQYLVLIKWILVCSFSCLHHNIQFKDAIIVCTSSLKMQFSIFNFKLLFSSNIFFYTRESIALLWDNLPGSWILLTAAAIDWVRMIIHLRIFMYKLDDPLPPSLISSAVSQGFSYSAKKIGACQILVCKPLPRSLKYNI